MQMQKKNSPSYTRRLAAYRKIASLHGKGQMPYHVVSEIMLLLAPFVTPLPNKLCTIELIRLADTEADTVIDIINCERGNLYIIGNYDYTVNLPSIAKWLGIIS
jgi:hypothetical protein